MTSPGNLPPVALPGTTTSEVVEVAAGLPSDEGPPPTERGASLWADAGRELRRSPAFLLAATVVLLVVSMAAIPWLWTRTDPRDCDIAKPRLTPGSGHIFGTNDLGCDYYAMTIYGARPSILVGAFVTLGIALIGGVLGVLSGYYSGWLDLVISRLTDIFAALPFLLGAVVFLTMIQTQSIWAVVAAITFLGWVLTTRLMRAAVLSTKNMDYVQAARAMGASTRRLIFRHILPNAIAPVVVVLTINFGAVVAAEATLSYLGIGLQPPTTSWGVMISQGDDYFQDKPHLLLFPGGFLVATVLSFIALGDALRDALDPKLR
jgi:peptide/nickel transport system permease protein/oligopeptide transport system permease protein